jgi:hypothetical protein
VGRKLCRGRNGGPFRSLLAGQELYCLESCCGHQIYDFIRFGAVFTSIGTLLTGAIVFDLPFHIRYRIYEYATVTGRVVRINYMRPAGVCPQTYTSRLEEGFQKEYLTPYSQSVSHFLDGPIPNPNIRLDRRCRCFMTDPYSSDDTICNCVPFPSQLLWFCPRLARVISCVFFSKNYFRICGSDLGGLSQPQFLPPTQRAAMTHISLNSSEYDRIPQPPWL